MTIRWSHAQLQETLLYSQWMKKPWTSNTRWPRAHMSGGLLRLMDSWFYPWWLRIACSVYAKKYKYLLIYSNVIWVLLCFGYLLKQIPRDVRFSIISGQSCEYHLVPYRDINIPCYLGRCFKGTIFCSVPWVTRVIRANTVLPRIIPGTQATRSIVYLGQELRQIKWPRVIV